jgi:cation diffusion facilitator family transporter
MSGHPEGGHGTRAIIAALLANLGIAIAKFVGFLLTRSSSLLAEAGHSLADTTNQFLLLVGGKQAKRDEDAMHPFGYGMSRYFWSFVVALILFSMGSLFALYEGASKLGHPHELESPLIAVGILVVAIALEGYSFRTAIGESKPLKGDRSWWQFIRTAKVPELPVLLLEDSGALIGLVIALFSILMAQITGDAHWDAYGTLAIGVLLGVIAAILIVEMRSLLLGESASKHDVARIAAAMESHSAVKRLIHLRTMHLGPEELLVAAKIELDAALTFAQVSATVDEVEVLVRAEVPTAKRIYLEPAVYDAARGTPVSS